MPNHLAQENSPYLLQHAANPVDWYPWGHEALARAHVENKPIFLSIGYAACHWCHVMAHESFEDQETAALLNRYFVSIKVDREQRPDLDSIYMQATTALTGSGGWPMSVFLTPDLRPFYAGTYFPPVRRYNLPAFNEILLGLARLWAEDPGEVDRVATQVLEHISSSTPSPAVTPPTAELLEGAERLLIDSYDREHGGWGRAPKFPQPMSIEFLLRRAARRVPSHAAALDAALHALKAMARGGLYDVVGGGFCRYSTDEYWRVPHFEKMLYDNAQLALAYLHAWQLTRDPLFKRVAVETLDFVQREMMDAAGGFFSSLDADSDGVEGKFYVWTKQELRLALPLDAEFELFSAAYGVTDAGNWEGKLVLQRSLDDASLASMFRTDPQHVADVLAACHSRLLGVRAARVRPALDDKILTAWNGLALQAFAEASRFIDEPIRRSAYLDVATRNASFLLSAWQTGGQLRRSWRRGSPSREVFLDDYGSLILGLLALYQSDFQGTWFVAAQALSGDMIESFSDNQGGFFDTAEDAESLLLRPKDLQDNATPSGNALACEALLRLAAFTGNSSYRDHAELALRLVLDSASSHPMAFARWLSAADFALGEEQQLALVYSSPLQAGPFLDTANAEFRPNLVIAASTYPPADTAPPLLAGRPLVGGQPTAYVCEHFACKLPVNTPDELRKLL
jgi:hypothetical protein